MSDQQRRPPTREEAMSPGTEDSDSVVTLTATLPESVAVVGDEMLRTAQAFKDIAEALQGLPREAAIRVLRASAILHGADLRCVGLQEIRLRAS